MKNMVGLTMAAARGDQGQQLCKARSGNLDQVPFLCWLKNKKAGKLSGGQRTAAEKCQAAQPGSVAVRPHVRTVDTQQRQPVILFSRPGGLSSSKISFLSLRVEDRMVDGQGLFDL